MPSSHIIYVISRILNSSIILLCVGLLLLSLIQMVSRLIFLDCYHHFSSQIGLTEHVFRYHSPIDYTIFTESSSMDYNSRSFPTRMPRVFRITKYLCRRERKELLGAVDEELNATALMHFLCYHRCKSAIDELFCMQ